MARPGQDFRDVPWNDMVRRLLLYAGSLVAQTGRLPGGVTAEDLVQTAITKTLNGTRVWNLDRVSLLGQLMGIIRSDFSHAVMSAESNWLVRTRSGTYDEIAPDYDRAKLLNENVSPEDQAAANEAVKAIRDHMRKTDADLSALLELIVNDVTTAVEQADQLNTTLAKVYELRRRLRRVTSSYLEKLDSGQRVDTNTEKVNANG